VANGNDLTPKTKTPGGVVGWLASLAGLLGFLLCTLFSPLVLGWGLGWGVVLTLVVIGTTTRFYTEDVPGYRARILLNHLGSGQRGIFQGLHLRLPWENQTFEIDVRVDLKGVHEETYTTLDGLMDTRYVYTMRPRLTSKDIVRYASFETDALKQLVRSLLSMMLSDYYGKNLCANLLNKAKINYEVFGVGFGKTMLEDFEDEHGVEITVRLEDSDYDEATQAARDTLSRARSLDEAIDILMTRRPDGTPGMSRPDAEKRAAQLQDLVHENLITIKAEGIPEGTNIAMFPIPELRGGNKGGGKKK